MWTEPESCWDGTSVDRLKTIDLIHDQIILIRLYDPVFLDGGMIVECFVFGYCKNKHSDIHWILAKRPRSDRTGHFQSQQKNKLQEKLLKQTKSIKPKADYLES